MIDVLEVDQEKIDNLDLSQGIIYVSEVATDDLELGNGVVLLIFGLH